MILISEDCTGCGVCESLNPDIFIVEDGRAVVQSVEDYDVDAIQEIADQCPVCAIQV